LLRESDAWLFLKSGKPLLNAARSFRAPVPDTVSGHLEFS
jgi:hypothetical protein